MEVCEQMLEMRVLLGYRTGMPILPPTESTQTATSRRSFPQSSQVCLPSLEVPFQNRNIHGSCLHKNLFLPSRACHFPLIPVPPLYLASSLACVSARTCLLLLQVYSMVNHRRSNLLSTILKAHTHPFPLKTQKTQAGPLSARSAKLQTSSALSNASAPLSSLIPHLLNCDGPFPRLFQHLRVTDGEGVQKSHLFDEISRQWKGEENVLSFQRRGISHRELTNDLLVTKTGLYITQHFLKDYSSRYSPGFDPLYGLSDTHVLYVFG